MVTTDACYLANAALFAPDCKLLPTKPSRSQRRRLDVTEWCICAGCESRRTSPLPLSTDSNHTHTLSWPWPPIIRLFLFSLTLQAEVWFLILKFSTRQSITREIALNCALFIVAILATISVRHLEPGPHRLPCMYLCHHGNAMLWNFSKRRKVKS